MVFRVDCTLTIVGRGGHSCVLERQLSLPFAPVKGLFLATKPDSAPLEIEQVFWDMKDEMFSIGFVDWVERDLTVKELLEDFGPEWTRHEDLDDVPVEPTITVEQLTESGEQLSVGTIPNPLLKEDFKALVVSIAHARAGEPFDGVDAEAVYKWASETTTNWNILQLVLQGQILVNWKENSVQFSSLRSLTPDQLKKFKQAIAAVRE